MNRTFSLSLPLALALALTLGLSFALALRTAVPLSASGPTAEPLTADRDARLAAGQALYQATCAACHGAEVEWTQPGCRPESLAGVSDRFSKQQVMNLLDHGVMQMPSFAGLPQEDRDLLWEYLSTLEGPASAVPTRGQRCPRVQAAMAGRPMPAGGCGQLGAGADVAGEPGAIGGGRARAGGGCGGRAVKAGGCGRAGAGCGGGCGAGPASLAAGRPCCASQADGRGPAGRRWSFGR